MPGELRALIKDRVRYALCVLAAFLFAAPLLAVALSARDAARPGPGPLKDPLRIAGQRDRLRFIAESVWKVRDLQTPLILTDAETQIEVISRDRRARFRLLDDGAIVPADEEARAVFRNFGKEP